MSTSKRYSSEVRKRAVRLVFDHEHSYPSQWAAIRSVAEKIGCTAETLRAGSAKPSGTTARAGPTNDERARIKELERENRELRRANEILRKASAASCIIATGARRTSLFATPGAWLRRDRAVGREPGRLLR